MSVPGTRVIEALGSKPAHSDAAVSIIIISYNTREMTLACIASILTETSVPYEVIVVDNFSSDGSAEAIRSTFPEVTLISEKTNHGFAGAHPIAISHSQNPYILLLNPDTVVLNAAIDHLLDFALKVPSAIIWGGRTIFGDGSLNPYSCWRKQSLWSIFCAVSGLSRLAPNSSVFNPEAYGGWQRDTERAVDIVTGCFLLIRRDMWERLGGFEPDFFMYGEEADLCLRARQFGASPRFTPTATIVHYGGASETVQSDKLVRIMSAKTELVKRHFGPVSRKLGKWLLACWPLSRKISLTAAAWILGSEDLARKAEIWSKVWSRRKEWKNGYEKKLSDR